MWQQPGSAPRIELAVRSGNLILLSPAATLLLWRPVKEGDLLRFHPARRLTRDDVAEVVAVVARRIERLLQRRGLAATPEESGAPDAWAEEAPVVAGIAAASVQGLVALGLRAGADWLAGADLAVIETAYGGQITRTLTIEDSRIDR